VVRTPQWGWAEFRVCMRPILKGRLVREPDCRQFVDRVKSHVEISYVLSLNRREAAPFAEFSNTASLIGLSCMWRNQTTCETSNVVATTSYFHHEMAAEHAQRAT